MGELPNDGGNVMFNSSGSMRRPELSINSTSLFVLAFNTKISVIMDSNETGCRSESSCVKKTGVVRIWNE